MMDACKYAQTYSKEQLAQKIDRLERVSYTATTMESALATCYALQEMNAALHDWDAYRTPSHREADEFGCKGF